MSEAEAKVQADHAWIRARLLETGRKCRLCSVIVQAAAGSLGEGMAAHKRVIHRIGIAEIIDGKPPE